MSKSGDKGKTEVTWRERELKVFKRPGETMIRTAITYTATGRAPHTIYLDKAKPSEDDVRKAIKEDLEKRPTTPEHKATL